MDIFYAQTAYSQNYSNLGNLLTVEKVIIGQHPKFFTNPTYLKNLNDLKTAFWVHDRFRFTQLQFLNIPNGYMKVASAKLLARFIDYGWVDVVQKHSGGSRPKPNIYAPSYKMNTEFAKYYRWLNRIHKIRRTRGELGDLMDDEKLMEGVKEQNRDVEDRKDNIQIYRTKRV